MICNFHLVFVLFFNLQSNDINKARSHTCKEGWKKKYMDNNVILFKPYF